MGPIVMKFPEKSNGCNIVMRMLLHQNPSPMKKGKIRHFMRKIIRVQNAFHHQKLSILKMRGYKCHRHMRQT